MLRPTVIAVTPADNYTLLLVFDSGETQCFDVNPYISGEWYSELRQEDYFKTVRANGYTVEWSNGQDLCPDELYFGSMPVA